MAARPRRKTCRFHQPGLDSLARQAHADGLTNAGSLDRAARLAVRRQRDAAGRGAAAKSRRRRLVGRRRGQAVVHDDAAIFARVDRQRSMRVVWRHGCSGPSDARPKSRCRAEGRRRKAGSERDSHAATTPRRQTRARPAENARHPPRDPHQLIPGGRRGADEACRPRWLLRAPVERGAAAPVQTPIEPSTNGQLAKWVWHLARACLWRPTAGTWPVRNGRATGVPGEAGQVAWAQCPHR